MHKYAGNMQSYAKLENMQVYANDMQEICTKYAYIDCIGQIITLICRKYYFQNMYNMRNM